MDDESNLMDQYKDEEESSVRKGEGDKTHFRSDRIVAMNGRFYFVTRENTEEGPFDSKQEALQELNLYIRIQNRTLSHLKEQK